MDKVEFLAAVSQRLDQDDSTRSVASAVYAATNNTGINFAVLAEELISRGWTYNGK